MSGENQYISPIIDAFLRRRQQDLQVQQEGVANEQKKAQIENENKYREALIKEAGERIDNAREEHQRQMDLLAQAHENAALATRNTIMQKVAEQIRNAPASKADEAGGNALKALGGTFTPKGGNPLTVGGQQLPGSPNAIGTIPLGNGQQSENINLSALPNAEDVAQNAGLKAGAVSDATIDNKLLQDKDKAQARHTNDMELTQTKIKGALDLADKNNLTRTQIAQMADKMHADANYTHNQTVLKAAAMHMGAGFDGDTSASMAERGHHLGIEILDGKGDYSKLPLADKYVTDAWAQANGIELPKTPAYSQTLSAVSGLPGLYAQEADLIHRFSADSKPIPADPKTGEVGSPGGSKWAAALQKNIPTIANLAGVGTQMDSAVKNLQKSAGTLAMAEEPKARQTGTIIGSQTLAAFNPNLSEAENMRNFENVKAKNSQRIDQDLFSGIPKPIADTIKVRHGLNTIEPTVGTPTVPARPLPTNPANSNHVMWPNATKAKGYNIYGSQPEPDNWQDYQNNFPPPPTQSPTAVPATSGIPGQGPQ